MNQAQYKQALYEELAEAYSDWNNATTYDDLIAAHNRINVFEYKLSLVKGN